MLCIYIIYIQTQAVTASTSFFLDSDLHPLAMASEQDPQPSAAASAPEAEQAQKLYDDPVTGEKISKTELKRRAKQREKAQAKAQTKTQAVAKAPKAAAGTAAGEDAQPEDELNPNVGIYLVAWRRPTASNGLHTHPEACWITAGLYDPRADRELLAILRASLQANRAPANPAESEPLSPQVPGQHAAWQLRQHVRGHQVGR